MSADLAMEKIVTNIDEQVTDLTSQSSLDLSTPDLEKGRVEPQEDTGRYELDLMRSVTRQDIYTATSAAQPHGVGDTDAENPKLVTWDGPDDPERPANMPVWRRWAIMVSTGLMTLSVTFGSSVYTSTVFATAEHFHVSSEVMLLGLSLYVLGFALGPLLWGPLSEVYGRTRPLWTGMIGFLIFQIPAAVAQDLQTLFVSRFMAGAFGAAPLAIVSGIFVDFLPAAQRGIATTIFMAAVMSGPALGPIVGNYVTYSHLGWRWTSWITLIMGSVFTLICMIVVPETFEPTLLRWRARRLRLETKDWALHAKSEEHALDLRNLVRLYLSKPLVMVTKEPILVIVTFYTALAFGILYLTFEAFPIAFALDRHWTLRNGSLPFLGILVGVFLACISIAVFTKTWYTRQLAKNGGKPVPEHRLPVMAAGSIMLPIGLFWFAWTSHPSTPWPAQVVSGIFIGAGIILVFQSAIVYTVDVYMLNAASAMAVNTFARSLAGAGFPMFSTYMYKSLGVDWATSILGFVCVALIPFPAIFWFYGARIRSWSRFAFAM